MKSSGLEFLVLRDYMEVVVEMIAEVAMPEMKFIDNGARQHVLLMVADEALEEVRIGEERKPVFANRFSSNNRDAREPLKNLNQKTITEDVNADRCIG